jgi:hypothetical protein
VRWLVAIALVGCTTAQPRRAQRVSEFTLVGGMFGLLGTSVGAALDTHDRGPLMIAGALCVPIVLVSTIVYVATDRVIEAPRAPDRNGRAETAMQLAKQAKRAARVGDCAEVQAIEPRVRALDDSIYLRFLRDPIIRPCRAPAPTLTQ